MIQAAREPKPPACMAWLPTFTGRRLDPRAITEADIDVRDLAHHLSLRCRFTCATPFLYSVGQHSLLVSAIVPPEHGLWGLLHDAGEFLLPDVARPIKDDPGLSALRDWELTTLRCVARRYILPWPMPECVHEADRIVLATEARDLFNGAIGWGLTERPLPEKILEMRPRDVEAMFLARFRQLWSEAEERRKEQGLG